MTNYFELYDLPVSFHPDPAQLKTKYYELSRRYHPDRFTQAGDAERADVLRMAALNNDAFKTLNQPDRLMAYILKLHGLLEEEEKYSLPPDFLMEMMDLNETVSEYEMEPDNETLKAATENMMQSRLAEWQQQVGPLTERFDKGEQQKELLLAIKDWYFRKKYLLRIQQRIATFASR